MSHTLSPEAAANLADTILALHAASALFIVFGLVAVPVGAHLRWPFVRVLWWRLLHAAALGTVALQKLLGQTCFLSVWEFRLLRMADHAPHAVPLIHTWGGRLIHVNLPLWLLTVGYAALFVYTVVLWLRVPPTLRPRMRY